MLKTRWDQLHLKTHPTATKNLTPTVPPRGASREHGALPSPQQHQARAKSSLGTILTHHSSCKETPTSPSHTACSLGAGGCCSHCRSSSCSGFPRKRHLKSKVRSAEVAAGTSSLHGSRGPHPLPASEHLSHLLPWCSLRCPHWSPPSPSTQHHPGSLLPIPGSHLLVVQLQDAAEGITGLCELLHLLLLRLVELGREEADAHCCTECGRSQPMPSLLH